jgi:hypothetical protein
MRIVQFAAVVLFLWLASSVLLSAESRDACKDEEARRAWDDTSNPVYFDAQELARTLNDRGFLVECIRRSKEENLFEGQKGAAWYQTDLGVFEVWFLPERENFSALRIIEQVKANGWYVYSFRGAPRIATRVDSAKPMSFIKHGSLLFEVRGDKQLAERLQVAFRAP